MKALLAALLFLIAPHVAFGQQRVSIDRVDIDWFGTYAVERSQLVDDPTSITGKRAQSDGIKLVTQTTRIPALRDTRFGVRFRIHGQPSGLPVDIVIVKRFPPIRNPATGKTAQESQQQVRAVIGQQSFTGYWLRNDWEVVTGQWVFEFWYENRKLAETTFNVAQP